MEVELAAAGLTGQVKFGQFLYQCPFWVQCVHFPAAHRVAYSSGDRHGAGSFLWTTFLLLWPWELTAFIMAAKVEVLMLLIPEICESPSESREERVTSCWLF